MEPKATVCVGVRFTRLQPPPELSGISGGQQTFAHVCICPVNAHAHIYIHTSAYYTHTHTRTLSFGCGHVALKWVSRRSIFVIGIRQNFRKVAHKGAVCFPAKPKQKHCLVFDRVLQGFKAVGHRRWCLGLGFRV